MYAQFSWFSLAVVYVLEKAKSFPCPLISKVAVCGHIFSSAMVPQWIKMLFLNENQIDHISFRACRLLYFWWEDVTSLSLPYFMSSLCWCYLIRAYKLEIMHNKGFSSYSDCLMLKYPQINGETLHFKIITSFQMQFPKEHRI